MTRAIRISLKEATPAKRRRLAALLGEFRTAANFYARVVCGDSGRLDAATLRRYTHGSLGYRQRSTALRLAVQTVIATRKAAGALGRRARCPVFRRAVQLSSHVATVEVGRGTFDYVLKISS